MESGVKYVKGNALAGRRFRDLDELNAGLLAWCLEVADQRMHGTTFERPSERFARSEAAQMVAVDARPPAPREQVKIQTVPCDALVPVESNRYPVPLEWAGRSVRVHLRTEEIVFGRDGEDLVRHARLLGKHQVARWNGPPRSVPPPGSPKADGPPQWDPSYVGTTGEVEVRSLGAYEAIAAGAGS